VSRIHNVISKQENTAVFPLVCADHCAHLLNINFSEVARDGEKLAYVLTYGYRLYGYDMVLVFSDPYVEAQSLGCPVRLEPFPCLLGPKSDKRLDRTGEIIRAAEILKNTLDVPLFVSIKGPFSLASFLFGIGDFLKMLVRNDKEARYAIEQTTEFQKTYIERLLSLKVNIFIGDPVASTSVISPEMFAKFAYTPLKVLITMVRDKGLLSGIHICGETRPILHILDTLGTDILSIEDITPETRTLKMGGVSTGTILYGDTNKISEEVKSALSEPNLIVSTSCDVPVDTSPENIKTIIRIAREISGN